MLFEHQLFVLDHLRKLFSGKTDVLLSRFGVGQACKIPFFSIPGVQDDASFLFVLFIWSPCSVDFASAARSGDDTKRLIEIGKEIEDLREILDKLEAKLEEEEAKDKPDQSKVDALKEKISDAQGEIDRLNNEAKKIARKKNNDKDDIGHDLQR